MQKEAPAKLLETDEFRHSGQPRRKPGAIRNPGFLNDSGFRRKPESGIFKHGKTAWTPVSTGVTTKKHFFQIFPFYKGGWGSFYRENNDL